MPPRRQFSKDQIVEAAFEIAKVEGISGLTVRKVAERLGSSVAPIYVNFKNAGELEDAVVEKTFALGKQLMNKRYTGDRLLDIGIASLRFAREYSVLFRELVLSDNRYMDDYQPTLGDDILAAMADAPELEGFTEEEVRTMFLKLRIFQVGLSTMAANDLLPAELGEEGEIQLLATIGEDIFAGAQWRKGGRIDESQSQGAATEHGDESQGESDIE